jgi:hypothetical protein
MSCVCKPLSLLNYIRNVGGLVSVQKIMNDLLTSRPVVVHVANVYVDIGTQQRLSIFILIYYVLIYINSTCLEYINY